jgi:hypothetical protein
MALNITAVVKYSLGGAQQWREVHAFFDYPPLPSVSEILFALAAAAGELQAEPQYLEGYTPEVESIGLDNILSIWES